MLVLFLLKIGIFKETSMKTGERKRASNRIQLNAFLAKYMKYINTSSTLQGIMVW
jgi:hypothetical protein